MNLEGSFFKPFSVSHFFTLWSQNGPRKVSKKCPKSVKIHVETPSRCSFAFVPPKRIPKVWKSYPLQRSKPISKGSRYPRKHHNLDPKRTPEQQIVSKMGVQKNSRKLAAKNRQLYLNCFKLGTPGATKVQPNCDNFRTFLHPGPEMGQESSRGPKKVAQGVQKVSKGFQKVTKSHEKAIHKAPTRRSNAMRKQQSNQATKQRRNEATKQQSNKATKQPSNQATKQQSNKATKAPRHPGTQARWREGRRQMDRYIAHIYIYIYITYIQYIQ